MKYRIKKVAVLGSGVMGSGIACHLANIGLEVVMLDIVPFDMTDDQKKDPVYRNSIVNGAFQNALKSKPASLYKKSFSSRITTGNFDDDFDKISDADWVIEVVIERLDIKKQILAEVEKRIKPDALVTSNTSSIPIEMLVEGRSDAFAANFCGTHFFNPPRYLPLFEVIPHATTNPDIVDFFMDYGDIYLGKRTVLCKDTPGFVANRIGVMSIAKTFQLTKKYDLSIEEVDSMTGALIARPNTATYRLQDLVGIDTGDKVSSFLSVACKTDEFFGPLANEESPAYIKFLLDNKFLGNKTRKGFYEKTNLRDENGARIINALNLNTLEYAPATKPRIAAVGSARKIEMLDKRLNHLIDGEDPENHFLKEYFLSLFAYAANRVPEIANEYYSIDDALRAGYMWEYGPFEYWDLIGLDKGIEFALAAGESLPSWIIEMQSAGATSFYKLEDGQKKYFNQSTKSYEAVPGTKGITILDALRTNTPVIKNNECTVHDIGDGVMCFEFTSKSNVIGEGTGQGLVDAIQKAEEEGWKGIVIGNNDKNFTVGANLMAVGMLAMQKDFGKLEEMVHGFQQVNMRIRTSKIPVVVATQGYVFGGGCEISMHCDAGIYAAESYIGLVEVGVGLLPGGGGTKEMALRASDKYFEGDVQMPTLIDHFKSIAMASVGTSAYEAFDYNYLKEGRDFVSVNGPKNISLAKEKVLQLATNYTPPSARNDIQVLGRGGLSTLYTAVNELRLGEYISDYDVEIAKKVAFIMCGGDLTSAQNVSEQYLLDLEKEGFLSLLGNQKTLDRIQYMLMNNKPLRN